MFKAIGTVLLFWSSLVWSLSLQCDPIKEKIAKITFSASEKGEEVMAALPKVHNGATLQGISVIYGANRELVISTELWPEDDDYEAAHFEVGPDHEQFVVRAWYTRGACSRDNDTLIQSWAARK